MNTNFITDLIKDLEIPLDISSGDCSFKDNVVLVSKVLSYVSKEINKFYDLDICISTIEDDSHIISLFIDISGFLREFGCPYTILLEGPLEDRYSSESSIYLLLTFLLTELMAAKVNASQRVSCNILAKSKVDTSENDNKLTILMKPALTILGVGRPPDKMTTELLFGKVEKILTEKLPAVPKYYLGKSLMASVKKLNDDQWCKVDSIITLSNDDHNSRRQTLIQRFDVTVQGLKWSPKAPSQMDNIIKAYSSLRADMNSKSPITLVDILAARDFPLTVIEKTCSGSLREKTKCKLNRMVMGPIPDRGGRPFEMEPPPPELPAFQKRDSSAQNSSFNNGQRGGSQGGFQNQGGYQDRGGYQGGNRGGYQDRGGYQGSKDGGQYQGGRGRGQFKDSMGAYREPNRSGGYHQGDTRSRGSAHNYRDQPDLYAQSVAPNNFYNQNDWVPQYVPQFQPQAYNQSSDYRSNNRNQSRGY